MRVRIRLKIKSEPQLAETALTGGFNQKTNGHVFAYAKAVALHNVTPVIQENQRQRIINSHNGKKRPCAYVEGDLIAWSGRLHETTRNVQENLQEQAYKLQKTNDNISRLFTDKARSATVIVFNPKKHKHFVTKPETGQEQKVFLRAKEMLICHWHFMAINPELRDISDSDLETTKAVKSKTEISEIPLGFQTTQNALAELGLIYT